MISMYLFGKPGWELEEGSELNPEILKSVGENIKKRCDEVAKVADKLLIDGWESEVGLYDVHFYHDDVNTTKEAEEHIENIGLDPKIFDIFDFEEGDCECEEFDEEEEEEEEDE